jgi:hypothetical protein
MKILARLTTSAKEFDRDLRRFLVQGAPHFLNRICQPVRIDVDTNVAAWAAHMIAELEASDRLFEFVSAIRTLEFDHMRFTHSAAPLDFVGGGAPLPASRRRRGPWLVGRKAATHLLAASRRPISSPFERRRSLMASMGSCQIVAGQSFPFEFVLGTRSSDTLLRC